MMHSYLELLKEHGLLVENRLRNHIETLPAPQYDHRKIISGDAFIAIKGASIDGHTLIGEALARGAAFVIGQDAQASIQVTDSRKAAAIYAGEYYGRPTDNFILYGITGTNGKTTVSLMLYQLLRLKGESCGWIGTLGYKINDEHFETKHTTPDILELHQIFRKMADSGVTHVVMEVSSHALALDRVYNVNFNYCLFTNLSRDHLDFHKDMEDYFAAKYLLFERALQKSATCIVNTDDDYGKIIAQRIRQNSGIIHCVGHDEEADWQISGDATSLSGSGFNLTFGKQNQFTIHSPLIGSFNIDNLALALVTLTAADNDPQALCDLVPQLRSVPGRIETVANDKGIGVYVDYAHTPDAIINLLKSIEKLPHRRIISIIGAGGDRDKGKRPLMLQAALRHSNAVIITDDNPRREDPNKIVEDIVRDREPALPWWIIRDRKQAIRAAIRMASPGDIVLICGKGHESYQEIGGIRFDFDDRIEAAEALQYTSAHKADDELFLPLDPLLIKLLAESEISEESDPGASCYQYISTDSRSIKAGSVFFAIKGERFDGNRYLCQVLEETDCYAVGSDPELRHSRYQYYEEPILLMAKILQKYLLMFDPYKIALTGSTGKTSTKELLATILESQAPTLKTLKNENNIIGLGKTILRLEPQHRYAVFEIGTNHFGEIALLADTIRPDAGIILNIGPSHLEYFGDEEGVYREKTELFQRPLDLRLYPADDPRFEAYRHSGKSVGFAPEADYVISDVQKAEGGQSYHLGDTRVELPYYASHYVINSAFAVALAMHLGISAPAISSAIKNPVALEMRMQVEPRKDGWLIVDCYNANPISMQSALDFWKDFHSALPHIAFLGDMLELGTTAKMYHNMVGAMLAEIPHEAAYSVGEHSRAYSPAPDKHFQNVDDLLQDFPGLPSNAVILVKASHGIHLEKLLPNLRGES
jgi:UDP-N-acetylmuramyl-tripeptide synthetase/UDP-N-acetylmuramoyl-tripeptide--D-alanyl-D-alanine ligase